MAVIGGYRSPGIADFLLTEHRDKGAALTSDPILLLGFKAFEATQDTLTDIELMHMIKKKQMVIEARDEGLTAAELFYSLAA